MFKSSQSIPEVKRSGRRFHKGSGSVEVEGYRVQELGPCWYEQTSRCAIKQASCDAQDVVQCSWVVFVTWRMCVKHLLLSFLIVGAQGLIGSGFEGVEFFGLRARK